LTVLTKYDLGATAVTPESLRSNNKEVISSLFNEEEKEEGCDAL
jgi:hypothetical protein